MDDVVDTKKRAADEVAAEGSSDTLKKQKCESVGDELKVDDGNKGEPKYILKKQLEYYFSDTNLSRDKFFHTKISSDENGWLDMKLILSCKKVQALNSSQQDIIAAVEGTGLEVKVDGNDVAWIRRLTPLPPLAPYEKKPRDSPGGAGGGRDRGGKGGKAGGKGGKVFHSIPKTVEAIHDLGCWMKVSGIPEEVSWQSIKTKLNEILVSKHPNAVSFVGPVGSGGETTVLLGKFGGDVEAAGAIKEIEINGANLSVKLVDDLAFLAALIPKLPRGLLDNREREYSKTMSTTSKPPIELGGSTFMSVDHLKKCYRELLEATPAGTELKNKPYGIIRALLDHHPNKEKSKDVRAIKVDQWTNEAGTETNKCFFVVREDGTCEDFSILKCIASLTSRPMPHSAPRRHNGSSNEMKHRATRAPKQEETKADETKPVDVAPEGAQEAALANTEATESFTTKTDPAS